MVITFAYLGAPRTTRQSRTMSLFGAIGVVSALRGTGFIAMVSGVHTPIVLLLPYLALIGAFVLGYLGISRGIITRAARLHHQPDQRDHGAPRATRRRPDGADVMIAGTLSRYFGLRFLSATVAVFAGAFALVAMIDFVEMLRRTGDIKDVSALFIAKITLLSRARSSPSG